MKKLDEIESVEAERRCGRSKNYSDTARRGREPKIQMNCLNIWRTEW